MPAIAHSRSTHSPSPSRYYAEALELWPEPTPNVPSCSFGRARSLQIVADDRAEQALEDARDALLDVGDIETAAEARHSCRTALWYQGKTDAADERLASAQALIEGEKPSAAKARVLCVTARSRMLAGDHDDALEIAQEALRTRRGARHSTSCARTRSRRSGR